uniref:Uncharacterized protein n=1 Tax=Panagrolaimus sp. JU765 TaxID=591449 RepID=A0AC34QG03_9BILA
MYFVAWLLVVQVCGVIADSVELTEDKTYWFIIPKGGFSIKICGEGSGEPKLCYDRFEGNRVRGECSASTSCVISARHFELQNKKQLMINYGGGSGFFKPKCAEIKVEEKIQYALNAIKNLNRNGTCQWKTDAKGMLAVDITTAVGFAMTILDVTQVPNDKESIVPFWIYIIVGCGIVAVLGLFVVGAYFWWKKKSDEK